MIEFTTVVNILLISTTKIIIVYLLRITFIFLNKFVISSPPSVSLQMRQLSVIPAGCSLRHLHMLACNGKYFAYAATTTVYVYLLNSYTCEKVLACTDSGIVCLAWSVKNVNLLAVAAANNTVQIIDVISELCVKKLNFESTQVILLWSPSMLSTLTSVGAVIFLNKIIFLLAKIF